MIQALESFLSQIPPTWLAAIGVWLVIVFGNSEKRDIFMENTWKLLTAPSELNDFSNEWIEKTEENFKNALVSPIKDLLFWLVNSCKSIWQTHQWKLIGQLVMLILLPFFFIADAIAISNVLDALGLPLENLPADILNFLGQYSIAVAAGTFFSVVISGFVLFEIFGLSEFSDFSSYKEPLKKIVKIMAVSIMLSSLFSGIVLGFAAWKAMGTMPEGLFWSDDLVFFCVNILVRANVLVSTGLILLEALKGLRSIISVLLALGILVAGLLFTIFSVIGSLGRLSLDWISRFIRWVLWLISFLVFAPIDAIKSSPQNLVSFIRNLSGKNSPKS